MRARPRRARWMAAAGSKVDAVRRARQGALAPAPAHRAERRSRQRARTTDGGPGRESWETGAQSQLPRAVGGIVAHRRGPGDAANLTPGKKVGRPVRAP